MKSVLDLTKAITDGHYYREQFSEISDMGNKPEKKILFVAPQLTSKHLYKFILPFLSFYNEKVFTAITGLEKYNPFVQIVQLGATLNQTEILWADYIVFPFTTMDLSKEYGLYEAIREVNPNCKIVFFVDFNYYNVPAEHPHKELFDVPHIIDSTERNVLYSDLCLTSNIMLRGFLLKKFTELADTKYKDVEHIPVNFGTIPYLIDEDIVLQNVEFELHKTAPVINKELFKKIAEVAEDIKKEDLETNKDKAKKLANKKTAPKKVAVKTTKVVANKGKSKNDKGKTADKGKGKAQDKNKAKGKEDKSNTPVINAETPETNVTAETNTNPPVPVVELKELSRKYKVGIICSPNNYHDIKFYNDEFQKINQRYGDNVSLVFVGYDYEEDVKDGKVGILDGVNFEYVKQVSIIHYFKQLESLELDLVLIPIEKNLFNVTSENYNKYLECGLFKIPILVEDMFPYNHIILHQRNGFLYKGKANLIAELDNVLTNYDLIKSVGEQSRKDVIQSYTYNDSNISLISSIYE